jgi:hypothetical protein
LPRSALTRNSCINVTAMIGVVAKITVVTTIVAAATAWGLFVVILG